MTTNFYAPPSTIRNDRVVLPEDEAQHAGTVLRVEEGDEIVVVDGEGGWYRTRVDHLGQEQLVGTVVARRSEVGEPDMDVTVGLGLLKERRRFETFVEKAVELGARRIVPLLTERTVAESLRRERTRNVMIAALKQCRRSRLPALAEPQSIDALLGASDVENQILCHATEDAVSLPQAVSDADGLASALLLVGPEGGFAPHEVATAVGRGCTPVSLGARRLRAETAGLAALHSLLLLAG